MHESTSVRWKWGLFAAIGMTLLALYPQINLWLARGREWNGAYVMVHQDEVAYSAYIQALIDGRPRRNNPYTGRDGIHRASGAHGRWDHADNLLATCHTHG